MSLPEISRMSFSRGRALACFKLAQKLEDDGGKMVLLLLV
jgi:hypothetical protein